MEENMEKAQNPNSTQNQNGSKKNKAKRVILLGSEIEDHMILEAGKIKKGFIKFMIRTCMDPNEISKYYVYRKLSDQFISLAEYFQGRDIICIEYDKYYQKLKVMVAECNEVDEYCELYFHSFNRIG